MLRVGLTGGLGSGKTAVALVWADAGVPVLHADALGRLLMEPGEPVHRAIVDAFGPGVAHPDGRLDRAALAREAFAHGGLDRLNQIVHPAVIAAQEQKLAELAATGLHPFAAVESAILFEASGAEGHAATAPGWRDRFDRIVLVTAPETERIERFVRRVAGPDTSANEHARLAADARQRMAAQLPEAWKRQQADYVIDNDRTLVLLRREALVVLRALQADARPGSAPPASR